MKKVRLSRNDLIKGLEKIAEEDTTVNIDDIQKSNDLKGDVCHFFECHKGSYLKNFLIETCKYQEKEIISERHRERLEILDKYVDFENVEERGDHCKEECKQPVFYETFTLTEGQTIFEKYSSEGKIKEDDSIKVVDPFEIFRNVPVSYSDCFTIKKNKKISFAKSLCLIIGKSNIVVAIGCLVEDETEYKVIIGNDKESISYKSLENTAKFKMLLFDESQDSILNEYKESGTIRGNLEAYTVGIKLKLSELKETNKPLCIDFGTSNTTAGTYGLRASNTTAGTYGLRTSEEDRISCVEFEYWNGNAIYTSMLLPTMAYVKSCVDKENIKFLFGYEAKEKVIESKYDTDATVYFELKRWITELNIPEESIEDEEGNSCKNVSRVKIITAYLKYVITLAEYYFKVKFKELHFSAPVKLKGKFIKEIQGMLSGYDVYASSKCLDEGNAIIYDYIANEIDQAIEMNQQNNLNQGKNRVLILDCGGGTTDLVNCEYSYKTDIKEGDASLEVSTQFENGNPNFGGNNITYRILQLIKIKMVGALYHGVVESEIDQLIPFNETDMLDEIDRNISENKRPVTCRIYERYEDEYAKCEKYIPTKYAESKYYKRESKRNYFYLWQLAEKIKIEFYRQANLATYNLENRIIVEQINDFYLYRRYDMEKDDIAKADEIPNIEVTNNEIKKIIYADIYAVMNDLFADIDITSFDKYKLSGQSCKVTLFQELLKEFITGKQLRETNLKATNSIENLKLGCINGCIAYTRGIKRGEIVRNKTIGKIYAPKQIYTVNIITKEINTIIQPGKPYGGMPFSTSADELKIEVRNVQNELSRPSFEFRLASEINCKKMTIRDVSDLIRKHSEISEDDLDQLCNELEGIKFSTSVLGMIIFATVSNDGYGFNLFQLHVKYNENKRDYYFPKMPEAEQTEYIPQYENFESATATFFDGYR